MRNALRLLVLVLTLAAVGLTAALLQLWAHHRSAERLRAHAAAEGDPAFVPVEAWQAHRADHQRAMLTLACVSLGAITLLALLFLTRRDPAPPADLARAREEINNLEHLARATIAQGEALARERDERHRAEENLHLQQLIANQALSEKVRLGRDLHDGIIQSLYATGLTLESARQKLPAQPDAASPLLDRSLTMLNTCIREIRTYIGNLSTRTPASARGFRSALDTVVQLLRADRQVVFDIAIDDARLRGIEDSQLADLLQIIREAVSNALRHGAARHVSIRLDQDDDQLRLVVQDDGRGFDIEAPAQAGPAAPGSSQGLANMRARAAQLGGELRVSSRPGEGARISLTFPDPDASIS